MGLAILFFFCFFWFSRCFFGFWPKVAKTSRKPKKNKIADPNSPACTYMGLAILFFLVFLFFFVFSRFFLFLTKSSKNIEKTKKNQNCRPYNSPACTYMGLAILFFFVFFCFLEVFWFLTKTSRKQKKTKKTKLQTLTHQLVPTWVLQFCFFLFFLFSRGFFVFDQM